MQMMREIEGVRNLASNVARLMEAGSYPALKKTKGVKVVAFQDDYTKKEAFHFHSLVFPLISSSQFSSMNTNCQIPFLLPPYSLAFDFIRSSLFYLYLFTNG